MIPLNPNLEPRGIVYILRHPNNTFLLQLRDEHSSNFPHMWCFPGGACDDDEDYLETVVREIKEETDLDMPKEKCHLFMKRIGDKNYVYMCDVASDVEPKVLEGADFQWKAIDDIKHLQLGFWQADIVKKLEKDFNYKKT